MSKSGRRLLVAEIGDGTRTIWERSYPDSQEYAAEIRRVSAYPGFKRWLVDAEFPQVTYSVALLKASPSEVTTGSRTSAYPDYTNWRRVVVENSDFIRWLIDDQPIPD